MDPKDLVAILNDGLEIWKRSYGVGLYKDGDCIQINKEEIPKLIEELQKLI